MRYLQNLIVHASHSSIDNDSFLGCGHSFGDLNQGMKGCYTYVQPIWTTDRNAAASMIHVHIGGERGDVGTDFAAGAGGAYRYIFVSHASNRKIKCVQLVEKHVAGWEHTCDLNAGRGGRYIYIAFQYDDDKRRRRRVMHEVCRLRTFTKPHITEDEEIKICIHFAKRAFSGDVDDEIFKKKWVREGILQGKKVAILANDSIVVVCSNVENVVHGIAYSPGISESSRLLLMQRDIEFTEETRKSYKSIDEFLEDCVLNDTVI